LGGSGGDSSTKPDKNAALAGEVTSAMVMAKTQKKKTSVAKKTLSPVWEEAFRSVGPHCSTVLLVCT
jgi:hypothetical protein